MSRFLKYSIILWSFLSIYINFYIIGFSFCMKNNILIKYDIFFFLFYSSCFIYVIYILKKNKILYFSIFIKIIIFTIFLIVYFFIEQLIINLNIYNLGNSGGFIRNIILKDSFYQFQWYEVLYWNFLFSLYYPIYIFIFFKPFVNHLDKSIKKIRDKDK